MKTVDFETRNVQLRSVRYRVMRQAPNRVIIHVFSNIVVDLRLRMSLFSQFVGAGIRLRIRTDIGNAVEPVVREARSQVFDTIWRELREA